MRTADGDVVVGTPDAKAEEDEDESNSNTEEEEDDDDESEEGSSGSGSDLDLALAEDGRVACPLLPHLPLDAFRAFPDKFALKKNGDDDASRRALLDDCREAFTARAATKREGPYSAGETYWLAADAEPRCALERLAKRVFEAHTREAAAALAAEEPGVFKNAGAAAGFDPRRSGAEWWTQVVDVDDEIGMHWDKDYALEAADVNVHPHIGTVTYFSSAGAPTFFARKRTPTFFRESVAGAFEDFETDRDAAFRRVKPRHSNANAFLSFPAFGKHVAFDGRWLHGALPELSQKNEGSPSASEAARADDARGETKKKNKRRERVTFLVNVWLNHVPSTATPLPKRALRRMAPIGAYAFREDVASHDGTNNEKDESVDVESVDVARIDGETRTIKRAFAHGAKTFSTRAAFPEAWFAGGAPGRGGSFALVGTGGEVVEVRGARRRKGRDETCDGELSSINTTVVSYA